jgi:peptidylprolyl isomerase
MPDSIRLIAFLFGATLFSAAAADDLIGKMGDVELHASDLRMILDAQPPEARKQLAADLPQLERLARNELVRRAALAEARQKGWDRKPEIQPLIERARDQVVVTTYVGNLTRPPEGYPSEEELKQFYDANKSQLMAPAQYQLSQIFLPAADDADKKAQAEALKKINDLAERAAKPGADFAKLARENSAHKESAPKGGDLGWVSEEQLPPEIRRVVSRMSKGEVSVPIKSAAGWHVMKLSEKRPPVLRPFADVRTSLTNVMRQRKVQDQERAYLDGLASRTPPTLNQIELNKLQGSLR